MLHPLEVRLSSETLPATVDQELDKPPSNQPIRRLQLETQEVEDWGQDNHVWLYCPCVYVCAYGFGGFGWTRSAVMFC